jgi:hypothetical protein
MRTGRSLAGLAIAALVAGVGGGVPGGGVPGGTAPSGAAGGMRLVSHVQAGQATGPACGWAVVQTPSPPADSLLNGVATRSSADAWVVGGSRSAEGDTISALIEHWDGTAWRVVPRPTPGQSSVLSGVAIASASNAWAVGSYEGNTAPRHDQTLIEHWNGRSWNQVPSPHPGGESWLTAVTVVSSRNAWAVGAYANQVGGRNKLFTVHWNGKTWRQVPVPVTATGVLYAVAATSWSDVWAVGGSADHTAIEHWDGTKWATEPSPAPGVSSGLTSVAASSARNVWAVGSYHVVPNDLTLALHCT